MRQTATSTSHKLAILLIALVVIGFIVGSTWAIYDNNLVRGSTDIYPAWQAGRLFWQDGINPYSDIVGEKSQQAIYGHLAESGQDEVRFVYPFYLILYIGPLPLLDFRLAGTIFMESLLLLLAATLLLSLDMLRWIPKPVTLGMSILFIFLQYFSVRGLLLAQPAFLAYGFHLAAYWALARRYDRLAGVMLALSTIKPQTGYLLFPCLLLWAWFNYRRPMIYAFMVTFAILLGISFILLPSWLFDWLDRLFRYPNYVETYPAMHIMTHFIKDMPSIISNGMQILLSLLVLIPVFLFWKKTILQRQNHDFLWGLMITMTAALLIAPRVATTSYVELYPAIIVGMMILERQKKIGWLVGGITLFTIGYWALHIATVPPREEAGREAPIVYVVFPVLVYLWLIWRRVDWKGIDILDRTPLADAQAST